MLTSIPNRQSPLPVQARSRPGKAALLLAALVMLPCEPVFAQSKDELSTLFFDAFFPDDSGIEFPEINQGFRLLPSSSGVQIETEPGKIREIRDNIQQYETSINAVITDNGTFDPALSQEYLSIGNLYLQIGDYEQAVLAYENAMHIQRVNKGLYTLDQQVAVKQLIAASKASGNYADADRYHEYLYYLQSRNYEPGHEDLVAASLEWADWNLEAFRRMVFQDEVSLSVSGSLSSLPAAMLRRGELVAIENDLNSEVLFIPRSEMIMGPAGVRSNPYTSEQLVDPRLQQAEDLYDAILGDSDESADNLVNNREAVYKRADITHLFHAQLVKNFGNESQGIGINSNVNRMMRSISTLRRGYTNNREHLETIALELEQTDRASAAMAYLDLADWDLRFDRASRAYDNYEKAWSLLTESGFPLDEINRIMNPAPAMFVPVFATYEDTRRFYGIAGNQQVPYKGYIDVTLSKRRDGGVRRVDITDASDGTSQRIRTRLLDLLRSSTFRPKIEAGLTVDQSDIMVRYYYTY